MTRISLYLLFKSSLAFLILLFQLPAFATDYYSINNGNFDDASTWSVNQRGLPESSIDFANGKNNFTIEDGYRLQVTSIVPISINNLIINGGRSYSRLLFQNSTNISFEIMGSLTINNGEIDFGTQSVNFIVQGNLLILGNTFIKQEPGKGKTQTLTLNGAKNNAFAYEKLGEGFGEVAYNRTGIQEIAPNYKAYSILKVSGGEKTLNESIIVNDGLYIGSPNTSIPTLITISSDLYYSGTEANLHVINGWVNTIGVGQFMNRNETGTDVIKTFPVGDSKAMQKITLSGSNVALNTIGVTFNGDINQSLDGEGMHAWKLFAINDFPLTIKINPTPDKSQPISSKTKIASYNDSDLKHTWHTKETTFSTDGSYTATINLYTQDKTWLMLYNCPTYTLTPSTISHGFVDKDYTSSPQFSVTRNGAPTSLNYLTLSTVPANATSLDNFTFASGVLKSKLPPALPKKIPFVLNYIDSNGCALEAPQPYSLVINIRSSPNLSIAAIDTKTFGDDSFQVHTFSRSSGKISYSIVGTNACAAINPATGFVTINCAGPAPNNQITVTAFQEADGMYKAESVSESFFIHPAAGGLYVKNYAFLVNSIESPIKVTTKPSDATPTFDQLSGFEVAEVDLLGHVTTLQPEGEFTVHIVLAATNNYTAFDSVYTFHVYSLHTAPIAINDTLVLEMSKDSTFNILKNDQGQTGEIIPYRTDIDIENKGQQVKFYLTELGNFNIDTAGNLTVKPFYGFIGSEKIGYTVSDLNGLTSGIAYVEVTVKSPDVKPELKANEIMTPNNDHLNDALVIANTDLSKMNSLTVLDDAGNTVYETINYHNNWEGTDKKGKKLEPGVYFYVFTEKDTGRTLQNYIQISGY